MRDLGHGTHTVDSLQVFTVVLLRAGERYLLMQRSASRSFAPSQWTGLGGRVKPAELNTLAQAALREVAEEASLPHEALMGLALRRTLTFSRPGEGITCLLYYTGDLGSPVALRSAEGRLDWLRREQLDELDIIDNTRQVLPLLGEDLKAPPGRVSHGAASYSPDGRLESIVWA